MTEKVTIRSDRNSDYKFMYKGEEVVLGAGKIIGIADGFGTYLFFQPVQ